MFKFSSPSRPVLTIVGALAVASAVLVSPTVSAGLDKIDASDKTKPTKVESMARIPATDGGSVLKCWQQGRLIFERSGADIEVDKLPAAMKIRSLGQTVQVLDLKQGVCILDQSTRSPVR